MASFTRLILLATTLVGLALAAPVESSPSVSVKLISADEVGPFTEIITAVVEEIAV